MPNKICPNCHSSIPEDSRFCFVCGSNLENASNGYNQPRPYPQQHFSAQQNTAQTPPIPQQPYSNRGNYPVGNNKGTNKGLIALIVFAVVAIIAIIILLTMLLMRGNENGKVEQTEIPHTADTTSAAEVTKTDTVYQTKVIQRVYKPSFQEGGTFKLSGKIRGVGGIRMTLTNNNGDVSGTYYYTKTGKPIYISGTCEGSHMSLSSEFDQLEGTISGSTYSGVLYVYESGREYSFSVKY